MKNKLDQQKGKQVKASSNRDRKNHLVNWIEERSEI